MSRTGHLRTTGKHILWFIAYLACAVILFHPLVFGHKMWYAADIANINYPQRHVLGTLWGQGVMPIWNPYNFGGQPLLAASQAGVFYPLNFLYVILPTATALTVSYLLHYAIAGFGMFLFLRQVRIRSRLAFIGGFLFMTSGFLIAHMIHTQMMESVAWLPYVLFFTDKVFRSETTRGVLRNAAGGALIIAIQWLVSHAQMSFDTLALTGVYAVFQLPGKPVWRWRGFFAVLLMMVLGTVTAGLQVLPTMQLMHMTFRNAISYTFFTTLSFGPQDWSLLFYPFLHGGGYAPHYLEEYLQEITGYMSLIAVALSVAALITGRKNRTVLFLGLLLIGGVLLSFGKYAPYYHIMFHVPGYNKFRIPARNLLFLTSVQLA